MRSNRTADRQDEMTTRTQEERRAFEANVGKSYVYRLLMDCSLTTPIWVLYLRDERGFSLAQITLMEVPLFLLITFAEIPTGAVADRFGRKFSLMLSSGIMALAVFVYGIATNYVVILISNLAWGLAFTFRSGADTALLYDSLKHAGREDDFSRINSRFWALGSTAMLAGLLLGAPIAAATSYTFAITVSAIIAACALPVALVMHEPKHTLEHAREPYVRTLVSGVRNAWRNPPLRWIFVYSGIVTAGAVGPLLLFQQPWLAEHGIGTANLGLWQAPVQAAEILSALAAGWLLSGLGERGAFLALPVTLFLCGIALAGIDHVWIAVAFVGMALVRGVHNPVLASYVNRRIDSRRRATVLSVQAVVANATLAGAWPLGGLVADTFGLQAVFLLFATATLVLGASALLQWARAEREGMTRAETHGLNIEAVRVA